MRYDKDTQTSREDSVEAIESPWIDRNGRGPLAIPKPRNDSIDAEGTRSFWFVAAHLRPNGRLVRRQAGSRVASPRIVSYRIVSRLVE